MHFNVVSTISLHSVFDGPDESFIKGAVGLFKAVKPFRSYKTRLIVIVCVSVREMGKERGTAREKQKKDEKRQAKVH